MKRRTLLKTAGGAITVLGTASASASAGDADPRKGENEGELPNRDVPVSDVHPMEGQPHTADTGDWIEHNWGFCHTEREVVREFIENSDLEIHIAGELLDEPKAYFRGITVTEGCSTDPAIPWKFYTPPKSPGRYQFSLDVFWKGSKVHFSQPYKVVKDQSQASSNSPRSGSLNQFNSNSTAPGKFV